MCIYVHVTHVHVHGAHHFSSVSQCTNCPRCTCNVHRRHHFSFVSQWAQWASMSILSDVYMYSTWCVYHLYFALSVGKAVHCVRHCTSSVLCVNSRPKTDMYIVHLLFWAITDMYWHLQRNASILCCLFTNFCRICLDCSTRAFCGAECGKPRVFHRQWTLSLLVQ
jgi:hypothetical protein